MYRQLIRQLKPSYSGGFHRSSSNDLRRSFCCNNNDIKVRNSLLSGSSSLFPSDGQGLGSEKTLNWYSCGPTVYDVGHIGHARNYICSDIILRILTRVLNVNVNYVMGLTDIDDKIINKAIARGYDDWKEVNAMTDSYAADFFRDLEAFNVTPPNTVLKVTNHIPDIIRYVEKIIKRGYGYVIPGSGVYFDIGRYTKDGYIYGQLGGVNMPSDDSNNANSSNNSASGVAQPWIGTGIEGEGEGGDDAEQRRQLKRDPRDFALWKCIGTEVSKTTATAAPLTFPSPWGAGRPGWHIECSAMTHALFGPEVDIHSGGIDLLFPHHTNEIAQCEAHNAQHEWVKTWLHMGHLYINGRKMSKSLKNFITMEEFLHSNEEVMQTLVAETASGAVAGSGAGATSGVVAGSPCPAADLRLCFLHYKYHAAIHFSPDVFRQAMQFRVRVENFGFLVQKAEVSARSSSSSRSAIVGLTSASESNQSPHNRYEHSNQLLEHLADCRLAVLAAYRNDFDTPTALQCLSNLITEACHYATDAVIKRGYLQSSDGDGGSGSDSDSADMCVCPPVEPLHTVHAYILDTLSQLGVDLRDRCSSRSNISHQIKGAGLNTVSVSAGDCVDELVQFRSKVRALAIQGLKKSKGVKRGKKASKNKNNVVDPANMDTKHDSADTDADAALAVMRTTLQELLNECDELRDGVAMNKLGVEITDVDSQNASWRFK